MIRATIDISAVVCAFVMVARMRHHITTQALQFGVAAAVIHAAGQLAILASPVLSTAEVGPPDLSASAVVFGFTLLTRGRWERLLADAYLVDPESQRNDLHGRIAWVMIPVLAFAALFHWAAGTF